MLSTTSAVAKRVSRLLEEFSLWRMDCLRYIGRLNLPPGFWGQLNIDSALPGKVCLTFDDGPDLSTTPQLLAELEQLGVPATFFLVGSRAAVHEDLLKQIFAGGHTIGNHSFQHRFLPSLPVAAQADEIDRTNAVILRATGQFPGLFRPPYGMMDGRTARLLSDRGMVSVYWGAAPLDWEVPGAATVAARVMRRLGNGALIVLHEGELLAEQTILAAKEIILRGKDLGCEFVSVPDLMATADNPPGHTTP